MISIMISYTGKYWHNITNNTGIIKYHSNSQKRLERFPTVACCQGFHWNPKNGSERFRTVSEIAGFSLGVRLQTVRNGSYGFMLFYFRPSLALFC